MPRPICPECGETEEGYAEMCTDLLRSIHDKQDEEALKANKARTALRDALNARKPKAAMPGLVCSKCGETGNKHTKSCNSLSKPMLNDQDQETSDKGSAKAVPKQEGGINSINSAAHRKAYAEGQVINNTRGIIKTTRIMVDNGNITQYSCAISPQFMKQMGLKYAQINRGSIPTAGKGSGMRKLGISEKFKIKLKGIKKTYEVDAIVCDLQDNINIGTKFLQMMATTNMNEGAPGAAPTLTFYKDGVTLTAEDNQIPLIQTVYDENEEEPEGTKDQCNMEPEEPTNPGGDFNMEPEPNKHERESRPTTRGT